MIKQKIPQKFKNFLDIKLVKFLMTMKITLTQQKSFLNINDKIIKKISFLYYLVNETFMLSNP